MPLDFARAGRSDNGHHILLPRGQGVLYDLWYADYSADATTIPDNAELILYLTAQGENQNDAAGGIAGGVARSNNPSIFMLRQWASEAPTDVGLIVTHLAFHVDLSRPIRLPWLAGGWIHAGALALEATIEVGYERVRATEEEIAFFTARYSARPRSVIPNI